MEGGQRTGPLLLHPLHVRIEALDSNPQKDAQAPPLLLRHLAVIATLSSTLACCISRGAVTGLPLREVRSHPPLQPLRRVPILPFSSQNPEWKVMTSL